MFSSQGSYLFYNSDFIRLLIDQYETDPVKKLSCNFYDDDFAVLSFYLFLEVKRYCRIGSSGGPGTFYQIASKLPVLPDCQ